MVSLCCNYDLELKLKSKSLFYSVDLFKRDRIDVRAHEEANYQIFSIKSLSLISMNQHSKII